MRKEHKYLIKIVAITLSVILSCGICIICVALCPDILVIGTVLLFLAYLLLHFWAIFSPIVKKYRIIKIIDDTAKVKAWQFIDNEINSDKKKYPTEYQMYLEVEDVYKKQYKKEKTEI